MEIVRLDPETDAPVDSDCITIVSLPNGQYRLLASALFEGDSDGDGSVGLIGGDTYSTFEAAEAAGLTWADEQGVETIYVERSSESDA